MVVKNNSGDAGREQTNISSVILEEYRLGGVNFNGTGQLDKTRLRVVYASCFDIYVDAFYQATFVAERVQKGKIGKLTNST